MSDENREHQPPPDAQRCAFVAIIGAPNAGKSTLVNALVGAKVSIVSHKVQTTRVPLRGIATEGDSQLVFIDTPGVFAPKKRLDTAMDSLLDGAIDKAAYDRAVERYSAEAEAATAELASLREADTAPILPELATVLRDAGTWQEILTGSEITKQRDVLALLIGRVVPERVGRGQYRAAITWTPFGQALRRLTEGTSAV